MSLLNIYVAPPGPGSYALVGVDTESQHVDSGTYFETTKLVPIAHLNAVLAFRGAAAVMGPIVGLAMSAPGSFDQCLEEGEKAFQAAIYGLDKAFEMQGMPSITVEDQEIALVGWSPRRRGYAARVWKRQSYAKGFEAIDVGTSFILGGDHEQIRQLRAPTTPAAMGELAKVQCRLTRELEPKDHPCGGRFIVAWLRDDGIRIETVCQLQSRAQA